MRILRRMGGTLLALALLCCLLATPALAAYNTVPTKPYPKLEEVAINSGSEPNAEIELKFSNNVAAISESQSGRPDMPGINEENLTKFSMQEKTSGEEIAITVEPHPAAAMHTEESKYFYVYAEGLDVTKEYVITVAEDLYANMGNSLGSPYEVTFCIETGEIDFEATEDLPPVEIVQPLYFTGASIENSQTNIAVDSEFILTFSHNVAGEEVLTYNTKFIGLFKGTSEMAIEVSAADDEEVKSLVLKPKKALAYETEYRIVVSKELMAKNGETLSSPVNLYFTTEKASSGSGGGGSGGGSSGGGGGSAADGNQSSNEQTKPADGSEKTEHPGDTTPKEVYFSDINGTWAQEDINYLAEKEVVSGNPDGSFAPDAGMTRAEAVTMLVRAFKIAGGNTTVSYTDTQQHWAKSYIAQAAAAGFATGMEDNTFAPDAKITREEFASMLVRAGNLAKGNHEAAVFTDKNKISTWALDSVVIANTNGLVNGYEDGTFGPQNNVTRAEACRMIVNLLKLQTTTAK